MNDFSEKKLPLNLHLARNGIASRRRSAELILNGEVKVNNAILRNPGYRVEPSDRIEFNGEVVGIPSEKKCYVLLNKPAGYECSRPTRFAARTVFELVDIPGKRLFTVGRLDKNSEGLLLLTDDGDFSDAVTHPSAQIAKTYRVRTRFALSKTDIEKMIEGIMDEGELLQARSVNPTGSPNGYIFILTSGKKREIRRLVHACGNQVEQLFRTAIGQLEIGNLPSGHWRLLSAEELKQCLE